MSPGAVPPDSVVMIADMQPTAAAAAAAAETAVPSTQTAAKGSGTSCCCGGAQGTAFRAAEKRYQQRMDQQIRVRNGRRHGGRIVLRPTDLSQVLDLHDASADSKPLPAGVHAVWWSPPCSASSNSSSSGGGKQDTDKSEPSSQQQQRSNITQQQRAYLFDRHPGLVYFPGALPADQQAGLIESALLSWPEPPARSNHTAAYPGGLPQLFKAARAGLKSAVEPQPEDDGAGGVYGGSGGSGQQQQSQHQQQQQLQQQQQSDAQSNEQQQGTASVTAAWTLDGPGPTAADILRRLRWVTLGPAFNWTTRMYEPWDPYTPLPCELRDMALAFEARAAALLAGAAGREAADGARGAMEVAGCQRPYAPDAALVNYYRPGDTLGGHVDDAEKDMAQPIVTASLGSAAIFLVGGTTRDDEPTALLLRSGDVLVLSGVARRSFHGVPRVLDSEPLPDGLVAAIERRCCGGGGEEAAVVEAALELRRAVHEVARGWRINISVRCIS